MNVDRALLSRAIEIGVIEVLVQRGIGAHHFDDATDRAVFEMTVSHLMRYGSTPSRAVVLAAFPAYRFDPTEEAIEYLLDAFVNRVQRRAFQQAILELADHADSAVHQGALDALLFEYAGRVARAVPSSRVAKLSDVPSRIERYTKMLNTGKIDGVSIGIPSLDKLILGVQRHELVVVQAPTNAGKSAALQHIAFNAYLSSPTERPLFITLEMDPDAILRRFDTMATNFRHQDLKGVRLSPIDMDKWRQWSQRAQSAPNDLIIIGGIEDCTVERVYAEIMRAQPTSVFVDYFGFMAPSITSRGQPRWQGMADMARALKRVPVVTNVPLFTACQTNRAGFREGTRLDNAADTIEISRSADVLIGLDRDDDNPLEAKLTLLKNRDGPRGEAMMNWDMATMDFWERSAFSPKANGRPVTAGLAGNPFMSAS